MQELQRYATPNIVIALAGNKLDLARDRIVNFEVGQWFTDVTSVTPLGAGLVYPHMSRKLNCMQRRMG